MTTHSIDPCASDHNPGSEEGASLFRKASREDHPEDKRFNVQPENSQEIVSLLRDECATFAWGIQVSNVPTRLEWDATTKETHWKGQKSTFNDLQELTLAHFQAQAACIWGDLNFPDEDSVKKFDFEDHAKSLKRR